MLLFALLALTPTATAILNVKEYNDKTDTITIRDWLGLSDYLTVKLVSNTNFCLIDCSATFELTPAQDMKPKDALEKLTFKHGLQKQIKYEIYYEDKAGNLKDFYKLKELSKGQTYKIIVIGHKNPAESIDWISTIGGLEISEWAWWNATWTKKVPITITAGTANIPAGYAATFNITSMANMSSDGSDIRFTNAAQDTELDYWREEINNGTSELVWVELTDAITASTSGTIYMYYNASGVTDASDGVATLDIFDGFDDASFNTTLWNNTAYNCTGTPALETGGILRMTANDSSASYACYNNIISNTYMAGDIFVRVKFQNYTNLTAFPPITGDGAYLMGGFSNATWGKIAWLSPNGATRAMMSHDCQYAPCPLLTSWTWNQFTGNTTDADMVTFDGGGSGARSDTGWFMVNKTANMTTLSRAYGAITNRTNGAAVNLTMYSTEPTRLAMLIATWNTTKTGVIIGADIDYAFMTEYAGEPTITLGSEVEVNVRVELNTPTAGYYIGNSSMDFNCSAFTEVPTSELLNVTFGINYGNGSSYTNNIDLTGLNQTNYTKLTTGVEVPTGTHTWYCLAYNNLGQDNTSRTLVDYHNYTATFNYSDYEGTDQTFTLDLNGSLFQSVAATMYWNGTAYDPTITNTSTTASATLIGTLPSVTSTTNITFYWNYTINNQNYTTATYPQQIIYLTPVTATNSTCGAGLTTARNYTWADEDTLTSLVNNTIYYDIQYGPSFNTSLKTFNGSTAGTTTFQICINSSQIYYVGYGELHYAHTSYFDRRYYIFTNNTFDGAADTINITLYHLNESDTPLIVEARSNTLSPYDGYYIALLRWYPAMASYYIVDMGKTDSAGQTLVHIRESDVDYRVALYYPNGTLVQLDDPTRITCTAYPCTYQMSLSPSLGQEYMDLYGIQYSLTNSNATKVVTFIWNDPSGNTQNMTLEVTKMNGAYETTICDTTGNGVTGVLSCNYSAYSGLLTVRAYRTASPDWWMIEMIIDAVTTLFTGGIGLFVSLILFLAICLLGVFSPYAAAVMTIVGLIPAIVLKSWSMVVLMPIAIMVIIVMHMVKKVS